MTKDKTKCLSISHPNLAGAKYDQVFRITDKRFDTLAWPFVRFQTPNRSNLRQTESKEQDCDEEKI